MRSAPVSAWITLAPATLPSTGAAGPRRPPVKGGMAVLPGPPPTRPQPTRPLPAPCRRGRGSGRGGRRRPTRPAAPHATRPRRPAQRRRRPPPEPRTLPAPWRTRHAGLSSLRRQRLPAQQRPAASHPAGRGGLSSGTHGPGSAPIVRAGRRRTRALRRRQGRRARALELRG